ncbi:universal stress protein MT2085-like isoform X1 [Biomphalaria glabrata]|nr:universal stress protein [Biomphalaria glabrata]
MVSDDQKSNSLDSHHHQLTSFKDEGSEATGRRVIVGVDGSEQSNYACDWYFSHLWSRGDYVILLHCPVDQIKNHWSRGVGHLFNREFTGKQLSEGENLIHHGLEHFQGILVKHAAMGKVCVIPARNPGDAILQTAEKECCDLIVIGCKGKSAIWRTLLGSISDDIINKSLIPVAVCRNAAPPRSSTDQVLPQRNLDRLKNLTELKVSA